MTITAGSWLTIGEQRYHIRKPIGAGGQASVWLAVRESDRKPVAIKTFEIKSGHLGPSITSTCNLVEREVKALSKLPSIHTPEYYGHVYHDKNGKPVAADPDKATHAYIAMEYVEGCSLQDYLDGYFKIGASYDYNDNHGLPFDQLKPLAAMMVVHLEHLHERGITHRDFKPSNLFLTREGKLKTGDFGFSITQPKNGRARTPVPCEESRAPELIDVSPNGYEPEKVDIWQLGVTLAYMLQGIHPFSLSKQLLRLIAPQNHSTMLGRMIKDGPRLPEISQWADTHTRNLLDLINLCLDTSPAGRPSLEDIKKHPFFEDIDWDAASKGELRAPIEMELLPVAESHGPLETSPVSFGSDTSPPGMLPKKFGAAKYCGDPELAKDTQHRSSLSVSSASNGSDSDNHCIASPYKTFTTSAGSIRTDESYPVPSAKITNDLSLPQKEQQQPASSSNARRVAAAFTLFTTSAVAAASEIKFHALSEGVPSLANSFIHSTTAIGIVGLLIVMLIALLAAIFNSPTKSDHDDLAPPSHFSSPAPSTA